MNSSKIKEILATNEIEQIKPLFQFDNTESEDRILLKFNLWARYFYPRFFPSKDASFHKQLDLYNLQVYLGKASTFIDVVFRGGAKTTRTKLFIAFCIANDKSKTRRYIKILTKANDNARQIVTDLYNLIGVGLMTTFYPEIFEKTQEKREETMSSFTTSTGIKVTADTVGTDQRGDIQEDARPDYIWFDDFETRLTLRSAVETQKIWDNMEEARTGLSKNGGAIYTCNYISERGNVHKLLEKKGPKRKQLIVPIIEEGVPTWDRFTVEDIEQLRVDADDFEGEYLCQPSAGADVFIDRNILLTQEKRKPVREIAGFKIFDEYDASHRYGGASDISGGVGLDSSTSVIIDFATIPCKVVATFKTNVVKPDTYGDEILRQGEMYGLPLWAPERNNHGHATLARLKQIYPLDKIYRTESKPSNVKDASFEKRTQYGFHTNPATKPKMLFDFKKAVESGLLILSDEDLIREAMSYSRDDLMDKAIDPRLTTRHFDLLIAAAIAWQLKDHAYSEEEELEQDFDLYSEVFN